MGLPYGNAYSPITQLCCLPPSGWRSCSDISINFHSAWLFTVVSLLRYTVHLLHLCYGTTHAGPHPEDKLCLFRSWVSVIRL